MANLAGTSSWYFGVMSRFSVSYLIYALDQKRRIEYFFSLRADMVGSISS